MKTMKQTFYLKHYKNKKIEAREQHKSAHYLSIITHERLVILPRNFKQNEKLQN